VVTEENLIESTGHKAGSLKGVVSNAKTGKVQFVRRYFANSMARGKRVRRLGSLSRRNRNSGIQAAPGLAQQGNSFTSRADSVVVELEDGTICGICLCNGSIKSIYKLRKR